MNMKKWLISLATVFNGLVFGGASVAQAQTYSGVRPVDRFSLVFETRSYHFGGGYNNFNPGAGFEYRLNRTFHVGAGGYYNSIENFSAYALVGAETTGSKFFGVGGEVGIITGYAYPVIPAAMPYVRIGSREGRFNLKIDALPPLPGVTPALVTLQVRMKLGQVNKPVFAERHRYHR